MRPLAILTMSLATASCAATVTPVAQDAASTDDICGIDPRRGDARDVNPFEPRCDLRDAGSCGPGSSCVHCIEITDSWNVCLTPCVSDCDCHDPARPFCRRAGCERALFCMAANECGCATCASEATSIAMLRGERAIPDVVVGDVVWGSRDDALVPVRVIRVSRTRVWHHTMIQLALANGRVVQMSAGHPTIDGRRFDEVSLGQDVGGATVRSVETVPYDGKYTYDLLTDGDRGAYVAEGVLVGSTLWESSARP